MLFNEALSERVEYKLEIERLLHFALINKEITLVYQPQISNKDSVIGCEVLVRWNNKKLGNVPPATFIPIAEDTGVIIELGAYILEESFKTLRDWDERAIHLDQFSINISMRQLLHANFVEFVHGMCDTYLTEELCKKVVFEMTETSVAEDIDRLISHMDALKKRGIRFSMDDFGTGYSSLSYLRQIPIHELKIDRSFVSKFQDGKVDGAMIKTILDIAKNLELSVVAEGVETGYQKAFLVENHCDILQGYFFSRPMDKDIFEGFLMGMAT
jgi:EAL domain-containing protein (putative c-di-GMP-specific phosphodiesterase class I)